MDQAAVALCKAGLRIHDSVYEPWVPVPVPHKYTASPALRGVANPPTVTGTNPAGGDRVMPGSTVSIILAGGTKYTLFAVPSRLCIPAKAPSGRT